MTAKLAGKLAARAIVSVQDGATLIPMLAVEDESGEAALHRLLQEPPEASIQHGQDAFESNPTGATRAAFVHDAELNTDECGDGLVLRAVAYREPKHVVQVVIPYRNAKSADGFDVFAPLVTASDQLSDSVVTDWMRAFWSGVRLDEEGAGLWDVVRAAPEHVRIAAPPWELKNPARGGMLDGERSLMASPVLVFFLVAVAEGEIDDAEIDAFSTAIADASDSPNPAIATLANWSMQMFEQTMQELNERRQDPLERLRDAAEGVAALSPDVAQLLRDWLLDLGKTVARSKKRGFFQGKISRKQQHALDLIASALTPTPSVLSSFSEDEAGSLRRAPLIMFTAVAAADGEIDPEEIKALAAILRSPPTTESALFNEAVADCARAAGQEIEALLAGKIDLIAELGKARDLVDARLSESDAFKFKEAVVAFGASIARASGDQSAPLSVEEADVLAKLTAVLGLQIV